VTDGQAARNDCLAITSWYGGKCVISQHKGHRLRWQCVVTCVQTASGAAERRNN